MKMNCKLALVLYTVLSLSCPILTEDKIKTLNLRTRLGNIIGFTDFRNARIFYNIPYGKAPTGSRKFAKPEPFGNWSQTRNGIEPSPLCPQVKSTFLKDFRQDEDCLILNIYTPVNVTGLLPVMVWIHGGGFVAGGAISYDGSALANAGIVVVTINYRLGLEGFLSFGDKYLKGNYGIWDQILALEWVRDNVEDYGGNAEEVTIFGESAGGMSVSLLSMIPENKGLFKRVIMQSGVASSVFAFQHGLADSMRAKAGQFGCPYDNVNPRVTFECMQQINSSSLVDATKNTFSNEPSAFLSFYPVVDGELFKKTTSEIFADDNSEELKFFRSLDVMIGTADSDGSLLLRMGKTDQETYGFDLQNEGIPQSALCDFLIPSLVTNLYKGNLENVADAMCKLYGRADDRAETSRQAIKMYADIFFLSPAVETLTVHSTSNTAANSYQFVFSEWSLPFFFDAKEFPPWYEGAGHATDLIYLFFLEFIPLLNPNITITESDLLLASKMRGQWTNFAKYGNPNSPGSAVEEWPPFDPNEKKFLQLNKLNMTVGVNYRGDKVQFVLETIPSLLATSSSATLGPKNIQLFLILLVVFLQRRFQRFI